MYEEVIILSIIFGFSAFVCGGIYKLIKLKISEGKGIEEEAFNRLAKAFMEYKKDTQRRLQNLEAIITDEDNASGSSRNSKQIEASEKTIEIEDRDTEKEESKSKSGNGDNNLRNMLRE